MIGKTIGGYRLLSTLGRGGMGTVYLAEGPRGRAAVKVLHPHLLDQHGYFKRFQQEVRLGRQVDHPNVARTLDGDMEILDGVPCCYLVMEYVEGRTLRSLKDEYGVFNEAQLREIARQVASGLAAIHAAGAVHRDLKPENIILTNEDIVKVMDLGVAKTDDDRISSTGEFIGSVPYAAPEQFAGHGAVLDMRADLFALGTMLYEFATGSHPFEGQEVLAVMYQIASRDVPRARGVNPAISPFLDEVIHRLLMKDPRYRFQSAADLLAALETSRLSPGGTDRYPSIHRPPMPREATVHGRQAELETLDAIYDEIRVGHGRAVFVVGPAGVGKTRFVDEMVARFAARGEDFDLLYGAWPPGGAASGIEAFTRAFADHLAGEGFEAAAARCLAAAPALAGPFAAVLRGEPQAVPRESISTAFCRVLQGLAEVRPVVLVAEDLHFAPAEGRALFASLSMAVPGHRVLLVGTTRHRLAEGWQAELERLEHFRLVGLESLPPPVMRALVSEVLVAPSAVELVGPLVIDRSEGNPFFAFEILRDLRQRGALVPREGGGFEARTRIEAIALPSSVAHLIEARLAVLDDEARSLLEAAACCGSVFDPLVVSDVLEQARIQTLRSLTQIERTHGLVHAAGRDFAFDSNLIRETLYASLSEPLRELYHAGIAERFERAAGGPARVSGARAADVCEHFLRGGQPRRALPHLRPALDHLERAYHNDRAVELAARALADPRLLCGAERVDLLLRLAALLDLTAKPDRARPFLEEALAAAAGDSRRLARVRAELGRLEHGLGENEAARASIEEAVRLSAEAGDPEAEARARMQLGILLHDVGKCVEARESFERSRALAAADGRRQAEASAVGNLGLLAWERGELESARDHYERCIRTFREIGDRRGEANATGILGLVLGDLGRHAEAAALHERHLEMSREIGYRRGEAIATSNLGQCLLALGRYREARDRFERDGLISAEIGDRLGVASSLINLGNVHVSRGDGARAREVLDRALAEGRRLESRRIEALALYWLGVLAAQEGRHEEGLPLLERASGIHREIDHAAGVGETAVAMGRSLFALGRLPEARERFADAVGIGRQHGFPAPLVLGQAWLGVVEPDAAAVACETYRERSGALTPPEGAEAAFALWRATGDPAFLETARGLLDALEATASEEERRSMRANVRLWRDVLAAQGDAAGPSRGG